VSGPFQNSQRFGESVRLSARRPELLGVLVGVLRLAPMIQYHAPKVMGLGP
jgi:hypothetical protein